MWQATGFRTTSNAEFRGRRNPINAGEALLGIQFRSGGQGYALADNGSTLF